MSESVLARVPVEYPDPDGQPMAENDWQLHAMIDAIAALDVYFRHRPDVYVSGRPADLPRGRQSGGAGGAGRVRRSRSGETDVQAVGGAQGTGLRDGGGVPEDLAAGCGERAHALCGAGGAGILAVRPAGGPSVAAASRSLLARGRLSPPAGPGVDGTRVLPSEVLGLDLRVEGGRLRFRDPVSGEDLRTLEEAETARREEAAARRESEIRLAQEAAARRAAEARISELRARLEAAPGKSEPWRCERRDP